MQQAHRSAHLPEIAVDENAPLPYQTFMMLRKVMHSHKQLWVRKLAEKDIHPGQAMCLWMLIANEGINQADLARLLHVARPTVTVMLQKMEKAGWIERTTDEQDQRHMRIYLTPSGSKLHGDLEAIHAEVVQSTIGQMAEEDQLSLQRLLTIVEGNIEEASR